MHQIIASPISFVKLYKHQSIVIAESAADVSCQIIMRRIHFPAPLLFESIESESEFSTSKRSSVLINAMWGWERNFPSGCAKDDKNISEIIQAWERNAILGCFAYCFCAS